MGVFDDHKLEQLDWMTQMTETIDSDLNSLLAKLPDRTHMTVKEIIESGGSSYMTLSVRDVVRKQIRRIDQQITLAWDEETILYKCFQFEVTGEPEIDLQSEVLTGGVAIVKVIQTLSDEDLQQLMGKRGIEALGRRRDYSNGVSIERMNEILDMLGKCEEDMRNRSVKKKAERLKSRLREIFQTNEWRIRDMQLANKVGLWIRGYLRDGNLADLVNLTKLKVMTHNNMPIYSVKEEQ
jgi:hypothetical protein